MVRREAWRLYLRTGFSFPFPCLEQIEEVEGKDVFLFRVGTRKKKRVIDTVRRSPTTFYFYFCFPLLCTRGLAANTWSTGDMSLCEGREERKKGGGGCLMDHGGLSGC